MIWANRSLDLITISSAVYGNVFSSVGQNKHGRLVTWWQYTERNLIWIKYYIGKNLWLWSIVNIHTVATHSPQSIRLIRAGAQPMQWRSFSKQLHFRCSNRDGDKEAKLTPAALSVLNQSTLNIHTCAWTHIHLKTLDWSAPEHNPSNEDHSANSCTSGVQTEMATKRRNSRPAALSVLNQSTLNIHTCAWTHIHLKTLDWSAPEHNPCTEDHSANSCTSGVQTEMATKRRNSRLQL